MYYLDNCVYRQWFCCCCCCCCCLKSKIGLKLTIHDPWSGWCSHVVRTLDRRQCFIFFIIRFGLPSRPFDTRLLVAFLVSSEVAATIYIKKEVCVFGCFSCLCCCSTQKSSQMVMRWFVVRKGSSSSRCRRRIV